MTTPSLDFRRPALLEGNSAGKLPTPHWKKWGWWFWPASAVAIGAGTYWGAQHIERQVESVAPVLVGKAGFDPTTLDFKASYRDVEVSGILPAEVSAKQLQLILAKYAGPNGESIRNANVRATQKIAPAMETPVAKAPDINPETIAIEPIAVEKADIDVAATVADEKLTLTGSVPSLSHAATLVAAAQLSFDKADIDNQLKVAEQPAALDNADQYISNLATVLSNLQDNVVEAKLNLDNKLLSGNISTDTPNAQRKLRAMILDAQVTVVAASNNADVEVETPTPINQVERLQQEIALLQDEIRAHVVFAPASDELPATAFPILEKVAAAMNHYPEPTVEIGGHTDSQSSESYNMSLSEKRAQAVAHYIARNGVPIERLRSIGYGESYPIFANDTAANRAKNRRVEFLAQRKN